LGVPPTLTRRVRKVVLAALRATWPHLVSAPRPRGPTHLVLQLLARPLRRIALRPDRLSGVACARSGVTSRTCGGSVWSSVSSRRLVTPSRACFYGSNSKPRSRSVVRSQARRERHGCARHQSSFAETTPCAAVPLERAGKPRVRLRCPQRGWARQLDEGNRSCFCCRTARQGDALRGGGDVVHQRSQPFSQITNGCVWIKKSLAPGGASQGGEHAAERTPSCTALWRAARRCARGCDQTPPTRAQ
jgi:hypothetical protein